MDENTKIENAKKIISYWYTMEFLNQAPIISKTTENKTLIKIHGSCKDSVAAVLQRQFGNRDFGPIDYYVGSFGREDVIKELTRLFGVDDPRVECSQKGDFEKLAFFLVQTDQSGHYAKNSFQLSPMLWARKQIASAKSRGADILNPEAYRAEVKKWDEKFQEIESENTARGIENDLAYRTLEKEGAAPSPCDSQTGLAVFQKHLHEFYKMLYQEYRISEWPAEPELPDIILDCAAYNKEEAKKEQAKKEQATQLPMISQNFFTDDLKMVWDALSGKNRWPNTTMGEILLNYVNDPNLEEDDIGKRIDVNARDSMSDEEKLSCKQFFATVLNARYAPTGRWPTQYPPALMQQVAINMVSQMEEKNKNPYFHINGPIFSVNGPPGTGKTTLLKEIIVNNIVQRARLLAQYEEADQAFEIRHFEHGTATKTNGPAFPDHRYDQYIPGYCVLKNDKINNYGMLVASCNNKAVENITTDIPVDEDVSTFIKGKRENNSQEKEQKNPFLSLDMEDFYFTAYTQALLDDTHAWGLIAAPMGKKDKIDKFLKTVANPLLFQNCRNENINQHKQMYKNVRSLFLEQCQKVESMQKELAEAGDLAFAELQKSCDKPLPENPFASMTPSEKESNANSLPGKSGGILSSIKRFTAWVSHSDEPPISPSCIATPTGSTDAEALYVAAKAKNEQIAAEEEKIFAAREKKSSEKYIPLDLSFVEDLFSKDTEIVTQRHTSDPGFTYEYDQERKNLFLLSLLLHKEFILSSKCVKYNLENFKMLKTGALPNKEKDKIPFTDKNTKYREDYDAAMGPVLQTLFLLTPVISTTFASAQRFLDGVPADTIGLLLVDESGQASPHMALGALFRSRAAVIVGDPKQVEPVVTDELDLLKKTFEQDLLYIPYLKKDNSVQTFADKLNHFGTYLKAPDGDGAGTWVGSPLVVHRRCISPMYDISNALSYNGIMKKASIEPSDEKKTLFWQPHSLWLDIKGKEIGDQNHFVPEHAKCIFDILQKSFANYTKVEEAPDIFIISPFKTVAEGMKSYISKHKEDLPGKTDELQNWMNTHIGTVHTFQGQGAQEVIFFPGCSESTKDGTLHFVNANIVNVAVTRAKSRLYVVGDWNTWQKNKNIKILQNVMTNMSDTAKIWHPNESCKTEIEIASSEPDKSIPPKDDTAIVKRNSAQTTSPEEAPFSKNKTAPTTPEKSPMTMSQKCPRCGAPMKRHETQKKPSRIYWKCHRCGHYNYEQPKHFPHSPKPQ